MEYDNKYEAFTFAKSKCYVGYRSELTYKIKPIEYDSNLFNKYLSNPELILAIFKNSCIGLFLTKSEASLFKVFKHHLSYFNDENTTETKESDTCKVIYLPNIIDPRYNEYLLQLPKYANIKITLWNKNFINLIKELDPFFDYDKIVESKQLQKEDI